MKMFKKVLCLLLTAALSATAVGCSTAGSQPPAAQAQTVEDADFNPQTDEDKAALSKKDDSLPEKLDLRNYNGKNYVTPVKNQAPFSSCWAFAMAAAAEISYLYDNDMGVPAGEVNNGVDFSEKYINWYMFHALGEDDVMRGAMPASQVGEGFDPYAMEGGLNAVYNATGNGLYGMNFYASGMGPVPEDTEINGRQPYVYASDHFWKNNTPDTDTAVAAARREFYYDVYKNNINALIKDGTIKNAEGFDAWFEENWQPGKSVYEKTFFDAKYAEFDDWTLPLTAEYRFPEVQCYFKSAHVLPSPADFDDDDKYQFNEAGLAAMKSELSKGRGISIGIFSDQSEPKEENGDTDYMNMTNWAQYIGDDHDMNHLVTVVGYDDSYKKENFTRTLGGKEVEGSTPPADGAFIIKNSWGALTEEDKATAVTDKNGNTVYKDHNAAEWGIDDTGYFYLSYYDHSIATPQTYQFYSDNELEHREINYDQYDLMQESQYNHLVFTSPTAEANVFTAEEDEYLMQLSTMVDTPMTEISYRVYTNVEDIPESGELIAKGKVHFDYAGYQRFDLDKSFYLKKGTRYSVVIEQKPREENGTTKYCITVPVVYNFRAAKGMKLSSVINKGESFFLSDGKWMDLSENKAEVEKVFYNDRLKAFGSEEKMLEEYVNGLKDVQIDNYPIKAFSVPARTISNTSD